MVAGTRYAIFFFIKKAVNPHFGPKRCHSDAFIFELKPKGTARPITSWDMSRAEHRNYKKQRK